MGLFVLGVQFHSLALTEAVIGLKTSWQDRLVVYRKVRNWIIEFLPHLTANFCCLPQWCDDMPIIYMGELSAWHGCLHICSALHVVSSIAQLTRLWKHHSYVSLKYHPRVIEVYFQNSFQLHILKSTVRFKDRKRRPLIMKFWANCDSKAVVIVKQLKHLSLKPELIL